MNQLWKCRRCGEMVNMELKKCGCTRSPSPWEPVERNTENCVDATKKFMNKNSVELKRVYDKILNRIDRNIFEEKATSGKFTVTEITDYFKIPYIRFYYVCKKLCIKPNTLKNKEYAKTKEFRQKMSMANKGKIRSAISKENYKNACNRREVKNNRLHGTYKHTENIKEKIKQSNKDNWRDENKPFKWLIATLENPDWHRKLSIASKGRSKTLQSIIKQIETKTGHTYEEWQNLKTEYRKYNQQVLVITRRQDKTNIKNFNVKQKGWHLDHIYSISDGWRNNIDPTIVGHFVNLRYVTAKENCTKNKKSDFTKETLYELYEQNK